MLDFAVRHNIQPITETHSFDQINEAMERLNSGKARYRIVLKHLTLTSRKLVFLKCIENLVGRCPPDYLGFISVQDLHNKFSHYLKEAWFDSISTI